MLGTQIGRTIRIGLINVIRNPFISFSVLFVMAVSLFIVGFSLLFGKVMEDVTDTLREKADITVYFELNSTEPQVFEFKDKVEALPQVQEVVYVSKIVALEEYKKRHENDPDILAGLEVLDEELPFRARLSIRAYEPREYESIVRFLENEDILSDNPTTIIDKIDWHQNREIIERLGSIVETVTTFSNFVIGLLIFISFLITINIERLVIYLNRDEIKVMRLIGADDWYVRTPFLVSGAIYGLLSAIIAIIVLYPVSYGLSPAVEKFFGVNGLFYYYLSTFFSTTSILIAVGVIVGVASSYLSTRRYLDD